MLKWKIPQKVYLAIILAGLIAFPWFQIARADSSVLNITGKVAVTGDIDVVATDQTGLDITTNIWYADAIKTTTGHSWFGGNIRVGKGLVNPSDMNGIFYSDQLTNPSSHRRGVFSALQAAQTVDVGKYVMVGGEFQSYILPTNTKDWTGSIRGSDSEVFTMTGSTGNVGEMIASFAGASVMGSPVGKLYGFLYGEVTITALVAEQYGLYIAPLTSATKNYAIFTNAGSIHLGGVPTSDPGIPGDIWSDNGTLKISSGTP